MLEFRVRSSKQSHPSDLLDLLVTEVELLGLVVQDLLQVDDPGALGHLLVQVLGGNVADKLLHHLLGHARDRVGDGNLERLGDPVELFLLGRDDTA